MTFDGPSADEISAMLVDRIEDVVGRLYPGAYHRGGVAYCSYKGGKNLGSFQVTTAGGHAGQWVRFSESSDRGGLRMGGHVLHLISYALTGRTTDYSTAFRWARDFLGIARYEETAEQREARERRDREARERAAEKRAAQDAADASKALRRRSQAGGQWHDAGPIVGTLAEQYLLSRGLPAALIARVCTPDVLRFNSSVHYDRPPFSDHPCLLGKVSAIDGTGAALGRVFLSPDGRKADLEDPKLTIGRMDGGAVRLGGMARRIGIAEGMETALGAMALCMGAMPVWAGLGTSGLAAFDVPPGVDEVIIYADGDRTRERGGRIITPGLDAANTLSRRLKQAGIRHEIALPPAGKDWLDVWVETSRLFGAEEWRFADEQAAA